MSMYARILLCTTILVAAWPAAESHAQSTQGAVRIGADLSVLTVHHYPTPDLPLTVDPTVIFGIYNTVSGLESAFLFAPQFGYGLTENLMLGAHIGLQIFSLVGGDVGVGFHLVPFLEYLFGEGDLRPYIGLEFGPRFIAPANSDAAVALVAGASGGVHIFLNEHFSLTPFLRADFLYNSANERAGYEVVLGISVLGWLLDGSSPGSSSSPAPAPAPAAPPPEPTYSPEDGAY